MKIINEKKASHQTGKKLFSGYVKKRFIIDQKKLLVCVQKIHCTFCKVSLLNF